MSWKWYGVKTLYRITAEGEPRATDGRHVADIDLIEGRVVLIRARSFEEAHKKATREAEIYAGQQSGHRNPYGQQVKVRPIDYQDAFECFDEPGAGAEVFSEMFEIPKHVPDEDLIAMHFDTSERGDVDRRTVFLDEEFSGRVR